MSDQLWIEPAGGPEQWKRFNRYTDGRPVRYISNHVALLSDEDYLRLPVATACLLHRLWLAFAETRANLPVDTLILSRICGQRVTKRQLERLRDAGFIRFSVTKPSRERYGFVTKTDASRARAEVEVEVKPPNPLSVNSNNKSKPACHICGIEHTTQAKLDDHLRNVHDVEIAIPF